MQRRRGHRTCRRKSRPLNTSINQEKRGYKEKNPCLGQREKSKRDSPAIRRRCTSWSKLRATGWSQGSVLAQSLSSSWVHRRNMARRHSLPIGRLCNSFNISNKIAIGTEYSTIDCKELTILTATLNKTGMSYIKCAWGFTDFFRERDWWRDLTWGS